MVLLETDQFLSRLTLMFDKARTKGHVAVTMKRYDGRTQPPPRTNPRPKPKKGQAPPKKKEAVRPELPPQGEYLCLLRAKLHHEKISSVIPSRDINKFQMAYCNLLRSNIDGLKRQKKVKTKKNTTD
ncbi:hypothetical protein TCAL_11187 [Tigriopus californicus]|uniref:Signal recognition particle 14 kDa protein n=1 Tax=Tigriopus californicus TaxID=6832 RepID=A0A553P4M3_TIGCA|nr:signal recognition particle 14 kDa protein-like [Tigriopus californicus]TRY72612.1 hypothetical protein TCAL_11187 [Tigriopus californicus]|eukprot:TCALIF_11187-PA protein Name:"Similar to SRP14 Signal recognition particle 14 kDa protein (Pongo abelii)" AED:0.02 eAED:0.02 QI:310/1/0.75/1/0.66/0.75/4/0/126